MALSMDEQRILDEIEGRLAAEDPGLAARMTAFGRPGLATTLRSRRGRMLASLIALLALAVVSVAVSVVVSINVRHPARPRPAPVSSQAVPGTAGNAPQAPAFAPATQRGGGAAKALGTSGPGAKPAR